MGVDGDEVEVFEVDAREADDDFEFPEDRFLGEEGRAEGVGREIEDEVYVFAGHDFGGGIEAPGSGPLLLADQGGVFGFSTARGFIPLDDGAQGEGAGGLAAAAFGGNPSQANGLAGAEGEAFKAEKGVAEFQDPAPAERADPDQGDRHKVEDGDDDAHHHRRVLLQDDPVYRGEKQDEEYREASGADGLGAQGAGCAFGVPVVFGERRFVGVKAAHFFAAAFGALLAPGVEPDEATNAAKHEAHRDERPVGNVEPAAGFDDAESEEDQPDPEAGHDGAKNNPGAGGHAQSMAARRDIASETSGWLKGGAIVGEGWHDGSVFDGLRLRCNHRAGVSDKTGVTSA